MRMGLLFDMGIVCCWRKNEKAHSNIEQAFSNWLFNTLSGFRTLIGCENRFAQTN